jgi:hypothetical protein
MGWVFGAERAERARAGALLIVLNHAGDVLSANIAMESAQSKAQLRQSK